MSELIQFRWVQGFHLNARNILFGGQILAWVDEDCTMCAANCCANEATLTTAGMDRINFYRPVKQGERLRFCYDICHVGNTSMTIQANVYNSVGELVFDGFSTLVCINKEGKPTDIKPCLKIKALAAVEEHEGWEFVEYLRKERKLHPPPKR